MGNVSQETSQLARAVLSLATAVEQMIEEPHTVGTSSTLRNSVQRCRHLAGELVTEAGDALTLDDPEKGRLDENPLG